MPILISKQKVVQPKVVVIEEHVKDKGKTVISQSMTQENVGEPVEVAPNTPMVGVDLGRTWSDGNYGSYRVGASLTLPVGVKIDLQKIEEAFGVVQKIVDMKVSSMLAGTPVDPKGAG